MTKEEREVMEMALDALEDWNFTMRSRPDEDIITAMKKCLANDALEKKAENARELGLDYEPEPVEVDQATMELAESVGLIGPTSRTHDLHYAIQRFHDLICVNATIKAAQMAANAIREATSPAQQEPVAWKTDDIELYVREDKFGFYNIPLYTHPPQPEKNEFKPDWNEKLALTEEVIRLSKRIEELEAQPEQEPVAQCTESDSWNCKYCRKTESCKALQDHRNFASPPQRKPLSDEEIGDEFVRFQVGGMFTPFLYAVRAIEAKLRSKNNG